MANSLEQVFKEDMELITRAVEKNINKVRTITYNGIKGAMSRRIFQQGIATDGSPIGTYEPSTARARKRGGRKTDIVNLALTDTLRNSLIVGTEGDRVTMGFQEGQTEPKTSTRGGRVYITGKTNYSVTDNAINQEKNFGKEIFAPTDDEVEKSQRQFIDELTDEITKELGEKTIRIRRT